MTRVHRRVAGQVLDDFQIRMVMTLVRIPVLMKSKRLSFETLEITGDDPLDKNWNKYK